VVGADWIKGQELSEYLNKRDIPGVRFYPVAFTPNDSKLKGIRVEGVRIVVLEREEVRATHLGLEIAAALIALYPGKVDLARNAKLIGNQATLDALASGQDPRTITANWAESLNEFIARRSQFLLYHE
jgi:uncharacterized protein YbbC (DUF1343 family)